MAKTTRKLKMLNYYVGISSCLSLNMILFIVQENLIQPWTRCLEYIANLNFSSLYEIHAGLCHPGITRTYHFIKMKNLPYSIEEVRKIVNGCRVCAEIKPRFHNPIESHLIKATQPMEHLSIDFKGPLPSSSKNKYLLTVIDEYSCFPFAFACSNIESQTVINCLQQIFYLFGAPGYVHSDRGKSFV